MLGLQVLPVIGEISDFVKEAYFINGKLNKFKVNITPKEVSSSALILP